MSDGNRKNITTTTICGRAMATMNDNRERRQTKESSFVVERGSFYLSIVGVLWKSYNIYSTKSLMFVVTELENT